MAGFDELAVYLSLTAEFGGQRFGPFEGLEVRLGSNKERCNIVLSEALGVAKEHCKVIRQRDGSLLLAPAARTAAVWLWKGEARSPVQIQTPTAVRAGDNFPVVSPEGPRFVIELAALPEEVLARRSNKGRRNRQGLTAEKFGREIWRRIIATLYTYGPIALANRAYYYVVSGAIWQPRILITGIIMLAGWITAGAGGCMALKSRFDIAKLTDKNDELSANVASLEEMSKGGTDAQKFSVLAGKSLGDSKVKTVLDKDSGFADVAKKEAKSLSENSDAYNWLYEGGATVNQWVQLRTTLEKTKGLDPKTGRLLAFAAAVPERYGEWSRVFDSSEGEVCGRGPMRLTRRQAKSLGLEVVAPDAFTRTVPEGQADRAKLVQETLAVGRESLPEPVPEFEAATISQGEQFCLYAPGDDDRLRQADVVDALRKQLGENGDELPGADANAASLLRLAKFYAADVAQNNYGAGVPILRFGKANGVSNPLEGQPGGEWVKKMVAQTVARALVLPCRAKLDYEDQKSAMETLFGTLPDPITCLVLNYRLSHS